jgi:actin-related protein 3
MFKTYRGQHPVTGAKVEIDVGYERFLGPEMFFHPEFINQDWTDPIDLVVDHSI